MRVHGIAAHVPLGMDLVGPIYVRRSTRPGHRGTVEPRQNAVEIEAEAAAISSRRGSGLKGTVPPISSGYVDDGAVPQAVSVRPV